MSAMKSFDEWEAEKLRDPELRAAFDALEPEFQRVRTRMLRKIARRTHIVRILRAALFWRVWLDE